MHCTLAQLLGRKRLSSLEFAYWLALDHIRAKERQDAQKKAKKESERNARRRR